MSKDCVIRAMTNDGAFRAIAVRTTDSAREAAEAQKTSGKVGAAFADLLTGVAMIRETMAPTLRVQGILKASGGGSLVADSHPDGRVRGLVGFGEAVAAVELSGATLQMMRTLPDGHLHQGFVRVDKGSVGDALMLYMQQSEQVTTMLAVGSILDESGVRAAGGYLVQLLPEASKGPLMVMTERLEDFRNIEPQLARGVEPSELLDELLYGMPYTLLGESGLRFGCWCSQLRMLSALTTLARREIEEMIADGQPLQISCDYCGRPYGISPAELRGLLEDS